ncbi:arf-GAP with coiled-coil, ANK repeat and PH domain-containing protein 2 [Lepisosteus oculatus]|uniref:arf-GAP with coiled-coil, ANK repeat and PH domain-containing protein 2 n=1 Tax=Lepisosteus oculatus TaxID=7918 RepID=UPI0035F525E2
MDTFLDFEECIKDSPTFRRTLDQCEDEVAELESRLEKVMKLCNRMVEAGQEYNSANELFLGAVKELSQYHQKDSTVTNCLGQFTQGLQEMIHFHTMLFDQARRSITQQLQSLLVQELPQLRETRRDFVRIGEDLETAGAKSAQASRHRALDAEKASHLLLATRKCFQHFALDYCLQLNNFKTQQKVDVLNSIFSYFHAQYTFFHQGYDLLKDLEPAMKKMATQLAQLSMDSTAKRKEMENNHLLVQQRDASGEAVVANSPGTGVIIEGYLFKRSRRKSKTWKRCWFSIENNQLVYTKSHKEEAIVMMEDLRLCTVKSLDNIDRRFCFEVVSVHKSCALQADSEELRRAWISAVQGSIDMAYRQRAESGHTQAALSPPSPQIRPQQQGQAAPRPAVMGVALEGAGNGQCCDCGELEPRWASVNLGITLCIECSGIHRSLGVHLSKVRSLTLDTWEPEQLKVVRALGNDAINRIYESRQEEEGRVKPGASSSRQEKEAWIKEKYVEKRFVWRAVSATSEMGQSERPGEGERERVGLMLYQAAQQGDLVTMATALAQGAEVNWANPEEEGRTALIAAACGGSLVACEFLLQNGANVNHRDQRGQGALHVATFWGHTGQVCLFLKKGANQYAVDERGKDPLSIAMENAQADIVTLLRMARMNEEMRDSEGFYGAMGDDETFQDIFRDFTNMASHDPEKLSRRTFGREKEEEASEGLGPGQGQGEG